PRNDGANCSGRRIGATAWRVTLDPHIRGDLVREHAFGGAHAADDRRDALARRRRQPLVGDGLEELADPKAAGIARGLPGRERMIGADTLVAVGDRAFLAQEEAAVVPEPGEVVVVAS